MREKDSEEWRCAHREFRAELAARAIAATRELSAQIHALDLIQRMADDAAWSESASPLVAQALQRKLDFLRPHDEVFASAIKLFVHRRASFEMWLSLYPKKMPGVGLTVAKQYIDEAAEIVQVAAEGYVFNLRKQRKRARRLLRQLDRLSLQKRINARRAANDTVPHEELLDELGMDVAADDL